MKTNILNKVLVAMAVVLLSAGAHAVVAIPSDEVIFTPTGFNQLIPENGPAGSEFLPAFAPAPGLPDQAIELTEPGTPAPQLSDALWVQNGYFYFESDDENGNLPNFSGFLNSFPVGGPPPPTVEIPETGQLQDLGVLLVGPNAPLPPGTLLVQSDLDVPEPSTLALLAIGGMAIGRMLRRKVC
jgi:hypothetical protein